jgi:hypothetical protein
MCAFYKTAAELETGRAAAFARIARLPYIEQFIILENYYGGTFPWHNAARAGGCL